MLVLTMTEKWINDLSEDEKIEVLRQVKQAFFAMFDGELWIPDNKQGISKNGNCYMTIIFNPKRNLLCIQDKPYSRFKISNDKNQASLDSFVGEQ